MSCRSYLKNIIPYKMGTKTVTLAENGSCVCGGAWTLTRLAWSLGRRERLTSKRVLVQTGGARSSQPYVPGLPWEAARCHLGFVVALLMPDSQNHPVERPNC